MVHQELVKVLVSGNNAFVRKSRYAAVTFNRNKCKQEYLRERVAAMERISGKKGGVLTSNEIKERCGGQNSKESATSSAAASSEITQ